MLSRRHVVRLTHTHAVGFNLVANVPVIGVAMICSRARAEVLVLDGIGDKVLVLDGIDAKGP